MLELDTLTIVKKRTQRVHRALKTFFIPHAGNAYHPHILHTKRAVLYSGLFVALKVFVIAFAVILPPEAFLAPDVLQAQGRKIIALTNQARGEQGLPALDSNTLLISSATFKAEDMSTQQYFSHTSPDGHVLSYFLAKAGYRYVTAGENLAMGFSDADAVVDAWMKSPAHYANLVDRDFAQFGVGLVAGEFEGKPNVFVAQHFGTPQDDVHEPVAVDSEPSPKPVKASLSNSAVVAIASSSPAEPVVTSTQKAVVQEVSATGTTIVLGSVIPESHVLNSVDSFVVWSDVGTHATQIVAQASINGSVKEAIVFVNGYSIPLRYDEKDGLYHGVLTAPISSKELFRVVLSPTIRVTWQNDELSFQEAIPWKNPKVVSQTPWERYLQANSWLSASISVFSVVHIVYWIALIFFSFVLLLSIVIEFRKQHPHVIAQTIGLLAILIVFLKY